MAIRTLLHPILMRWLKKGVTFLRASSNAPQCSPARSTLISGSYATSFGADYHRKIVKSPQSRLYFPSLLRKAGYFTTNNSKKDYNTALSDWKLNKTWNESGQGASYNSSKRGNKPFFSVFNSGVTHMSRLATRHIDGRRDFTANGIGDSADAISYLPRLPEIISDYQFHQEGVTDIDLWVGNILQDLKDNNLHKNTIVFVFSDHGGSSPRGKGFLYESGLQVPLIIYAPKKYRHLLPIDPGTKSNQLVSFVDFGPTLLSMVGIKPPKAMQGNAFMGDFKKAPRVHSYAYRTNQGIHYDPWRAVSDKKYKYIKTYLRRKPIMLKNSFQWNMPGNIAMDIFARGNPLSAFTKEFYGAKAGEMLYNLKSDPHEEKNLVEKPFHANDLLRLRETASLHIRQSRDLGFVPIEMRSSTQTIDDWLTENSIDMDTIYNLAETVSEAKPANISYFSAFLTHGNVLERFWAAQGFAELAAFNHIDQLPEDLRNAQWDADETVRTVVLEALCYLQEPGALKSLISLNNNHSRSALQTMAHLKYALLKDRVDSIGAINSENDEQLLNNLGYLVSTWPAKNSKAYIKGKKRNKERRSFSDHMP